MTRDPVRGATYAFDHFRFDTQPYRLLDRGARVEMTPQQAQLLELLIEHAGEVVSREQIRQRLWPPDVHVDFDRGINFCVARLRSGLGGRRGQPCCIETVPRRGYRFVAALRLEPAATGSAVAESDQAVTPAVVAGGPSGAPPATVPRWRFHARTVLVLVLAAGFVGWSARQDAETAGEMAVRAEPPASTPGACSARVLASSLVPKAAAALERACWQESKPGVDSVPGAIAAYEIVLAHHPDLVPVLARLAELHVIRGDYARGEPLADRALRWSPEHPAALHALAQVAFRRRFEWPQAERLFRRALARAPGDETLRIDFASLLAAMGRTGEAVALAEETAARDALSLEARTDLAEKLYLAGRFGDAISQAQRVIAIDPNAFSAHRIILNSRLAEGDPVAALAAANRGLEPWGWGPAAAESLEAFAELTLSHQNFGDSIDQVQLPERAAATLVAGRPEEARRLMERACAERSGWNLPYYDVDPRFAPFHRFPGLGSLEQCLREPHDLGRADTSPGRDR